MDLGLKGKRALVMGGSRGLGRGIAEALAAEGATIALVSRTQPSLDQAALEIAAKHPGSTVFGIAGDLATPGSVPDAYRAVVERLGGIDILINNSGGPPPTSVSGVASEVWRSQFESMVLAIIGLTDLALPAMRSQKWGRILTIASSGVIQPLAAIGISNTLRSALVGWSKTLSADVAADGVTVNMLIPGFIETERLVEIDKVKAQRESKSLDQVAAESKRAIPLGRYGTVEEFGAVAAFLASAKASYVTGTLMRIDGGVIRSV